MSLNGELFVVTFIQELCANCTIGSSSFHPVVLLCIAPVLKELF